MKNYVLYALCAAVILLGLFFAAFERKKYSPGKIMLGVTLCVFATIGRAIFAFIPQVQPVSAIVIIAGAALGPRWGFLTGAMTAFTSNMIMGQGPWTPYQMLAWGIIGGAAGIIFSKKENVPIWAVCIFSFFSAFFFSIVTDIHTVTSIGEAVTPAMAASVFGAGLLFNISHAVGNVIFTLLLHKPLLKKINRIKNKYEVI